MSRTAPEGVPPVTGGGGGRRDPVKVAAYVVSAFGALLGPFCLFAFPGLGAWTGTTVKDAWVVVPAMLILASPFAAFFLAAHLARTRAGAAVVLAFGVVATLFGALIYVDAVVRKNVFLLLAFVGIPAVQWLMALPAVVGALVLRPKKPAVASSSRARKYNSPSRR